MKSADSVRKEIEERTNILPLLEKLDTAFPEDTPFWYWVSGIVVNGLTRKQLLNAIKTLGGRWNKNFEASGFLTYQQRIGGFSIELKTKELPSSCKLVKRTEVVPAVPEHTREVFAIECLEDDKVVIDAN